MYHTVKRYIDCSWKKRANYSLLKSNTKLKEMFFSCLLVYESKDKVLGVISSHRAGSPAGLALFININYAYAMSDTRRVVTAYNWIINYL